MSRLNFEQQVARFWFAVPRLKTGNRQLGTGNRFYSEIRNPQSAIGINAFPEIAPALPFSKGGELLEKGYEEGHFRIFLSIRNPQSASGLPRNPSRPPFFKGRRTFGKRGTKRGILRLFKRVNCSDFYFFQSEIRNPQSHYDIRRSPPS